MAKVKDPTDYDKAKLQPTQPRKKKAKPGQSVGGDLQGSANRGRLK